MDYTIDTGRRAIMPIIILSSVVVSISASALGASRRLETKAKYSQVAV